MRNVRNATNRDPAMDAIRCIALLLVIVVHFFGNVGFYEENLIGIDFYIMMIVRTISRICVPLFITLTGYLTCHKVIGKAYYCKIFRIILVYILASIVCEFYNNVINEQKSSFLTLITNILEFKAAPYSWYVEMYIGLFLLCPFLNILYSSQKNRRTKQYLLATALVLTAAPGVANMLVNVVNICGSILLGYEAVVREATLFPDYWKEMYPCTYYLIGCYLREYGVSGSARTWMVRFFVVGIISGTVYWFINRGTIFFWGAYIGNGSLDAVLLTIALFGFFMKLDYTKMSQHVSSGLRRMSELSFGAYLVSYIFDHMFFYVLRRIVPVMRLRLRYFIIIVPAVFLCSLMLSIILEKTVTLLGLCWRKSVRYLES